GLFVSVLFFQFFQIIIDLPLLDTSVLRGPLHGFFPVEPLGNVMLKMIFYAHFLPLFLLFTLNLLSAPPLNDQHALAFRLALLIVLRGLRQNSAECSLMLLCQLPAHSDTPAAQSVCQNLQRFLESV